MSGLCPDCREAKRRWVEESGHLVHRSGIRFISHAAYDDTAAGMHDNRRARVNAYYALVRRQCALIHEICAARHQVAPGIEPLPTPAPWGQLDLFGDAA